MKGDDNISGRLGRDVMYGGDGSDTFAFDDQHTGDASWGLGDAIGDFGPEDFIDITATEVFQFAGFDNPNPGRGSYSIWRGGDNAYVTWNTYGKLQDVELTGFQGDHYSLQNRILWYEDDYAATIATDGILVPGEAVEGRIGDGRGPGLVPIEVEADHALCLRPQGCGRRRRHAGRPVPLPLRRERAVQRTRLRNPLSCGGRRRDVLRLGAVIRRGRDLYPRRDGRTFMPTTSATLSRPVGRFPPARASREGWERRRIRTGSRSTCRRGSSTPSHCSAGPRAAERYRIGAGPL